MNQGGPKQGNNPFDKKRKAPSRGRRPDGTIQARPRKPANNRLQKNPDKRSVKMPDERSRRIQDTSSERRTGSRIERKPGSRPGTKPDSHPERKPGSRANQVPNMQKKTTPDMRPQAFRDQNDQAFYLSQPFPVQTDSVYVPSQPFPGHEDDFRGNGKTASEEARHSKIVSADRLDHLRSTHRKNTVSRALSMTLVVMLFLVVAAAAVLYITDYVAAKPNCAFVSTGTIEHSIGTTALIVRDEQTFTSPTQGTLAALALEGSRVSKDQALAMIIPEGLESTTASLNNAQQQIVELQRQLMSEGKGSGAQTICDEADSQILPIIKMIRSDSLSNSLSNLISYSSSIQVLMDTRDSALQNIDFQDEQLNSLIAGKQELENTLSAQAATLSSAIPGIVSYKLDGLESALNTSVITEMTPEQYYEYLEKSKGTISSDLAIKKDEAALRICQNAEQYLVTVVKGYSVTDFPVDASVNIRVPSEGVVIENCKVVRAVQSTGGVFIVMQTGSQVERLLDRRTVEIEIIRSSNTGLRVPASALVNADYKMGYAEILYNSSGYAAKLTVTVIDHDREYAIIAPVEATPNVPDTSTIIITNPETIKVGDKIE